MNHILFNGNIYPQVKGKICVTALVIQAGRIIAVGSDEEILSTYKNNAILTDLEHRTVLPGFTDAHIHLSLVRTKLTEGGLRNWNHYKNAWSRVKEKSKSIPPVGNGCWVTVGIIIAGMAFMEQKRSSNNLDICQPIYLTAKSLHAGWANSKALQAANITKTSLDPVGGVIQRDQVGEPTGILFESAMALVERAIPQPTANELQHAIHYAQVKLNKYGFTGIHDFDSMDCFNALGSLLDEARPEP